MIGDACLLAVAALTTAGAAGIARQNIVHSLALPQA